MEALMELLRDRQGKMSNEQFANMVGLRGATLGRCYRGESILGTSALQKFASEFVKRGDMVMLGALAAYALGISVETAKLEKVGVSLAGNGVQSAEQVKCPAEKMKALEC